jgi:hypothetical protein
LYSFLLERRPQSSGNFLLLPHADAMWGKAFDITEKADVNVQLSKGANESAPVHSQRSGGFAFIPIDLSENDKDKLLSKFFQRLGIEDARAVHPQHQCLKLRLRSVRMFSAHVEPGKALHREHGTIG